MRFCLSLLEKSNASSLHGSFDRFSLWLWRTFKIYFHRPLQRNVIEMVMCLFLLSVHPDCTEIRVLPRKGVSWTTPAKCRGKWAVSRGGVAGNSSLCGSGAVTSRCFESFSDTFSLSFPRKKTVLPHPADPGWLSPLPYIILYLSLLIRNIDSGWGFFYFPRRYGVCSSYKI